MDARALYPRSGRPPLRSASLTGREMRLRTSGGGAGRIGRRRRDASQASTSARSQTTHRGVRRKRFGNSPRCSISQMVLSARGTICSNCAFLIDRISGGSDRVITLLPINPGESKAKARARTSRQFATAILRAAVKAVRSPGGSPLNDAAGPCHAVDLAPGIPFDVTTGSCRAQGDDATPPGVAPGEAVIDGANAEN